MSVDPVAEHLPPWYRARGNLFVRGAFGSRTGRAGVAIAVLVLGVALLGPLFSPHSPGEVVGRPFADPSAELVLGTDALGRDALTRFLHGGRTLVTVAFLATVLAYLVGVAVGMAAGFRRGIFDLAAVGVVDLLLAFPPIVFVLVLLGAVGPSLTLIVVGIAGVHAPRIVRIVRSVALEVSTQEFVEAAVARGESLISILRRDILPNTWTPVLADFGLRFSGSVILFSSLSYLGLGQPPPAADWGLMISENRAALVIQPWVVVVPAATIALLTIGVNLLTDSVARSAGRSVTSRGV